MPVHAPFQSLLDYSTNPVFLCCLVFFVTFVLEEGAAVLAVLLTVAHKLPLPWASTALYCGVVSSDVSLYGLGYSVSRFKWAARWGRGLRLRRAGEWMDNRLALAVILSRLLPWTLPPTFIACGFFRLSFRRFLLLTASTGAVWTVLVFGALLGFGQSLIPTSHVWRWAVIALGLFALFAWKASFAPRATGFLDAGSAGDEFSARWAPADRTPEAQAAICWYEVLPAWVFYTPVALYWLWLALRYRSLTLPTAANPTFEAGGLVGESKEQVTSQVAPEAQSWFAPFVAIRRSRSPAGAILDVERALSAMHARGLSFPVVAKPDRGHQGYGVQPVRSKQELIEYMNNFPEGETLLLQRLVPLQGEAGVFYVRRPGERFGQIFSLNLSEPVEVVGDGKTSLRGLILRNPSLSRRRDIHFSEQRERLDWIASDGERVTLAFARSHRLGARLVDGRHCVTPSLLARFDTIADGIAGFHFGRFEVRFQHIDDFKRGDAFQIVEINGAGAEANHIWDSKTSMWQAYKTLFAQYRLAFQIGDMNRRRGVQPLGMKGLWQYYRRQQSLVKQFRKIRSSKVV